jgi:hypothetical protein
VFAGSVIASRQVTMAGRLGHVLYWFFCTVAGLWMTFVIYAFDKMTLTQNLFGLGMVAAIWFIGWALRYILTGIGDLFYVDVLSRFNRDH